MGDNNNFMALPPFRGGGGRSGGGRQIWRGGGGNRNWRGGPRGQFQRGRGGGRHRGGRGRGRNDNNYGRGFRGGRGGRGGGRGRNLSFGAGSEIFEEVGTPTESSVTIAVEGCCHGELDSIYERIRSHEEKSGQKVDLLICCGDFQSIRHPVDFHSFAAPPKYRNLGSFHQYYSGAKKAPILTLFVGGNHENSQQLQELYYGGWVAPSIYYLGAAGVVRFKGIRIGGISGIFKGQHYRLGHFERPPYNSSTLRSVYHARIFEVFRLKCLDKARRLDVMVSHDWPQGIENHGNTRYLLSRKPYFQSEVEQNCLGSPANHEILQALRPKLWFAAHLHVGFRATVNFSAATASKASVTDLVPSQLKHGEGSPSSKNDKKTSNSAEGIDSGQNKQGDSQPPSASVDVCQPVSTAEQIEQSTKFISLDKCLPGRHFLSIAHIEPLHTETNEAAQLEYDPEWLAILRKTHEITEAGNQNQHIPTDLMMVTSEEVEWVKQQLESRNKDKDGSALAIPDNFSITVPPATADGARQTRNLPSALPMMGNPQTDQLLEILGLDHIVTIPYDPNCLQSIDLNMSRPGQHSVQSYADDNEIDIDDALDDSRERPSKDVVEDENDIDIDIDSKGKGDDDEVAKSTQDNNDIDIADKGDDDFGDTAPGNHEADVSPRLHESDSKRPRIGSN